MDSVVGFFAVDVDGRFKSSRNKETNLGSFVADILRASTHADLAILNSGTFRSDRVHEAGILTMRDIVRIERFFATQVFLIRSRRLWLTHGMESVKQESRFRLRFSRLWTP